LTPEQEQEYRDRVRAWLRRRHPLLARLPQLKPLHPYWLRLDRRVRPWRYSARRIERTVQRLLDAIRREPETPQQQDWFWDEHERFYTKGRKADGR
jgi:hypothetical protein